MSIVAIMASWYPHPKRRSPALAALVVFVPFVLGLGACSVSFQGPSLLSGDDVTGSIDKPVALSGGLDEEDTRRAFAAMGAALDPASSGTAVAWDNPQSGSHGSFKPVASSYPRAKLTCRTFLADLSVTASEAKRLQGTACRLGEGSWFIRDVNPWTAS